MRPYQVGFTVIELLIVVMIIGVIAVFFVSSFLEYGAHQQYQAAVVEVGSVLKETRSRTLAAESDEQFGIVFGASSLTVFDGSYTVGAPSNRVYSFPGVQLQTNFAGGTTTLIFARLTGIPNATGTIVLVHDRSSASTTITVSESGVIW